MLRKLVSTWVVAAIFWLSGCFSFVSAQSASVEFEVKTVATGLNFPWGMAFLPDGNLLVTERVGRLRIISPDGSVSDPLQGVPAVFTEKQGGLLDVAIDPDFARNHRIYLSYAEPRGKLAGTAVARATLAGLEIKNLEVIFRQLPKKESAQHFGSRLVFAPDGNLFVTLGDRGKYMEEAQRIENHLGTLVRIHPDGTVPADNPLVKNPQAKPEIWSYGHRNIQGAALHPETGALWIHEHGPRGGDEINIPQPGKNYGWPKASYGIHYWMAPIRDEHAEQGYEEPSYYWTPSIAPSGMVFYTGELFPAWRGNLFVGALAGKQLVRLVTDGEKVIQEEQLLRGLARIRDVEQGPEGALYLLTDDANGLLLKLVPKASARKP